MLFSLLVGRTVAKLICAEAHLDVVPVSVRLPVDTDCIITIYSSN
jgi:hypothetical protein